MITDCAITIRAACFKRFTKYFVFLILGASYSSNGERRSGSTSPPDCNIPNTMGVKTSLVTAHDMFSSKSTPLKRDLSPLLKTVKQHPQTLEISPPLPQTPSRLDYLQQYSTTTTHHNSIPQETSSPEYSHGHAMNGNRRSSHNDSFSRDRRSTASKLHKLSILN